MKMTTPLKYYKDDTLLVERVGITDDVVFKMLKKASKHTGEYKELFNPYMSPKDYPSGSIVLICKDGTDEVGILIAKEISINKHAFMSIELIDTISSFNKKQSCIMSLLAKLYEICSNRFIECIIADYIDDDFNEIIKSLENAKFEKIRKLFAISVSKLLDSKKEDDMEVVEFNSSNKTIYADRLTDLLTDHDEQVNKSFNDSVGKKLVNAQLKGDSNHERKMRFFIESLAKDDRWLVVLINQKAMTLGYAKVRVPEYGKIGFIDSYNAEKEKEKVFEFSVKELAKRVGKKLDIFFSGVNITYKEELSLYENVFGKSIGGTYFLSIQ